MLQENFNTQSNIIDYFLSQLGKRMFFPKGIVAQAEQSAGAKIKATAGQAFNADGSVMSLPELQSLLTGELGSLTESIAYAPVAGIPALRKEWITHINKRNPSLNTAYISTPIVTSGLTHGVSCVLHLFLDAEDVLISPNFYWENYAHIVQTTIGASIESFNMFDDKENFNIAGLEFLLEQHFQKQKKVIILLNSPNNPTGYSFRKNEVEDLFVLLKNYAEKGLPILTIHDDAYFGLFYEDDIYQESLFAQLSQLHENILSVKIDGATKELLAWGLRVGFLTFGGKGITSDQKEYLEEKIVGFIRGTVTSGARISQNIVLKLLQSNTLPASIEAHRLQLKERYQALKQVISKMQEKYPDSKISTVPCNSGYFISFLFDTEQEASSIRKNILEIESVALVNLENKLRFAFSCVEKDTIYHIVELIYKYSEGNP